MLVLRARGAATVYGRGQAEIEPRPRPASLREGDVEPLVQLPVEERVRPTPQRCGSEAASRPAPLAAGDFEVVKVVPKETEPPRMPSLTPRPSSSFSARHSSLAGSPAHT